MCPSSNTSTEWLKGGKVFVFWVGEGLMVPEVSVPLGGEGMAEQRPL